MCKQKPAHEIRHRSIKATIWKNETPNGAWHNVTVTRLYKDGEESPAFSVTVSGLNPEPTTSRPAPFNWAMALVT